MKKAVCRGGLILLLMVAFLSCGRVYRKGGVGLKVVKAQWKQIYFGDNLTKEKYLIVALDVFSPGPEDRPTLSLSARDESGESYIQGSNTHTYHGRRTRIDTCFLVTQTDRKLYLIAGDFDPIPISPK